MTTKKRIFTSIILAASIIVGFVVWKNNQSITPDEAYNKAENGDVSIAIKVYDIGWDNLVLVNEDMIIELLPEEEKIDFEENESYVITFDNSNQDMIRKIEKRKIKWEKSPIQYHQLKYAYDWEK